MTPAELLAFEEDIAQSFARGEIASPIHLAGGNEQQLIDMFADIQPQDWVLCAWRSHYHCLLKGVPPAELKARILQGHSIALTFPEHKILCSAIVGGIAPIAVGLGIGCKARNEVEINHMTRVHVFMGDMTATTGIVQEAVKYAAGHRLPIRWIVEDNGVSVCTPTDEAWGDVPDDTAGVIGYQHTLTRPHSGIGQHVQF